MMSSSTQPFKFDGRRHAEGGWAVWAGGTLAALLVLWAAPVTAADWPQWRGPHRDGISTEQGLLTSWPEGGPPLLWKASDIGTGYSSPSIAEGLVLLQTTRGDEELALALDEATGKVRWSSPIGKVGVNRGPQYPGTRSTPTVSGKRVFCLASDGQLNCLEIASGKSVWQSHLQKELNGTPGSWAYTESVLVDSGRVICTPGGDQATLAALDAESGKLIWKSSIPDAGSAEYASIMILGEGADKQYVQFVRKGLVGVAANSGELLWRYDRTIDQGANILTPVIRGNLVFSAGSRTGGGLVQITSSGSQRSAEERYFERGLSPSIGGALLIGDQLYGTNRNAFFCADFATGKLHWSERALGAASLCVADGRIYLRSHNSGTVALAEPSTEGYREVGRFEQPERSDKQAWPHPVVANGRLYLRDQNLLLCYDVRARQ